jgi:hypothetical protein
MHSRQHGPGEAFAHAADYRGNLSAPVTWLFVRK